MHNLQQEKRTWNLKLPQILKIQHNSEYDVKIIPNSAKSTCYSACQNLIEKKGFPHAVFEIWVLKATLKLMAFPAGHVAMLTYCVTKMIPLCSPTTEQFLDAYWLYL